LASQPSQSKRKVKNKLPNILIASRACIRPEVSRAFNFGRQGVSGGLFYDDHIGKILINQDRSVQFVGYDRDTLQFDQNTNLSQQNNIVDSRFFLKEHYDAIYFKQTYSLSEEVTPERLDDILKTPKPLDFLEYANNSNIMVAKTVPLVSPPISVPPSVSYLPTI
jgi:hypothetical protein